MTERRSQRAGSETAASASEREQFEAYIRKDCGDLSTFGSGQNLHYCNSAVNHEWLGWMARARIASAASASVQEPMLFANWADSQEVTLTPDQRSWAWRAWVARPTLSESSQGVMGAEVAPAAEAAAWKWGYEYLQSRMESIGREGWAHDCDGEIQFRIGATK